MARAAWLPALPSMQAPTRRHVLHAAPHSRTVVERLGRHLVGAAQLRDSELLTWGRQAAGDGEEQRRAGASGKRSSNSSSQLKMGTRKATCALRESMV